MFEWEPPAAAESDEPEREKEVTVWLTHTPVRPAPAFLPLRAALVVVLPPLIAFLGLPVQYPAILWATLGLALASVVASYLLERRGLLEKQPYRWMLPAADVILVALLHQGSAGATSPFFPLFYVPIAYAGLLNGYAGGLVAALGATSAYGILYAISPTQPSDWMALSVMLLFPMAGAVSGYIGHCFTRLNAQGKRMLDQAKMLYRDVEGRRALYEHWYRAVDRLKADFVFSASHELRTPLTPVKGYVQFLMSPDVSIPEEKRKEYMQIISSNVDMLAQLVDDILYLQRVTRIPIDLEEISIPQVAQEAIEEVAGEAEEAQVQIQLEHLGGLPMVLGSSDSIKLVMANLLETLIRDSPAGSIVNLTLQPAVGGVEVEVAGAGRGIPVEHQERIFDLFFHADSSPTYVLGQEGLGLAVARYIVEMHGGKVTVEYPPRGGTAFSIYLPGQK